VVFCCFVRSRWYVVSLLDGDGVLLFFLVGGVVFVLPEESGVLLFFKMEVVFFVLSD
jgi:hypothetical protein